MSMVLGISFDLIRHFLSALYCYFPRGREAVFSALSVLLFLSLFVPLLYPWLYRLYGLCRLRRVVVPECVLCSIRKACSAFSLAGSVLDAFVG